MGSHLLLCWTDAIAEYARFLEKLELQVNSARARTRKISDTKHSHLFVQPFDGESFAVAAIHRNMFDELRRVEDSGTQDYSHSRLNLNLRPRRPLQTCSDRYRQNQET